MQLLARQRRQNVLDVYLYLSVDIDAHQSLADSQFVPRMCCYLCPSAPGDSELHPLVAEEGQGLTTDAKVKETALQILYSLAKSPVGKQALREQRVLPVLRRWRATEDSGTATASAQPHGKTSESRAILEIVCALVQ